LEETKHAEMLEWYRTLIRLRRSSPALNDGDLGHVKVQFDEKARWLSMDRGPMRVIFNLGEHLAEFDAGQCRHLVMASSDGVKVTQGKAALPPDSVAIFSDGKD
jgi:maltooligosyltrehalose trehalohydrolase